MTSESLARVATDIVAATREQPRESFDDVLRRYSHLLCDNEKARIVASHINAAIGGKPEGENYLCAMLQEHAQQAMAATVSEAEVATAEAAMWQAFESGRSAPGAGGDDRPL